MPLIPSSLVSFASHTIGGNVQEKKHINAKLIKKEELSTKSAFAWPIYMTIFGVRKSSEISKSFENLTQWILEDYQLEAVEHKDDSYFSRSFVSEFFDGSVIWDDNYDSYEDKDVVPTHSLKTMGLAKKKKWSIFREINRSFSK